jgi:hypothetical protein
VPATRVPSEHLAVVSIDDEDDADDIALPAGDLEDITSAGSSALPLLSVMRGPLRRSDWHWRSGSFIDYGSEELLIGGFAVMAARSCRPVNTFMQMGSGNAKHVSDCLHREAPSAATRAAGSVFLPGPC